MVVPDATAVTVPLDVPIVAIVLLPPLQVPPVTELVNVLVEPTHTEVEPEKVPGVAPTVTVFVA